MKSKRKQGNPEVREAAWILEYLSQLRKIAQISDLRERRNAYDEHAGNFRTLAARCRQFGWKETAAQAEKYEKEALQLRDQCLSV